jgi:putative oxidoreductase
MNLPKLSDLDSLSRYQDVALLLMRIVIAGYLVFNHGWSTLQNFLNGVAEYPDPLHFGPRNTMALMVFTELGCASFVVLGLFTRLLSIPVAIGFSVAVFVHHWPDPFGWKETPSIYWASFIAFAILGPGKYSLDYLLFKRK